MTAHHWQEVSSLCNASSGGAPTASCHVRKDHAWLASVNAAEVDVAVSHAHHIPEEAAASSYPPVEIWEC